MGYTYTLAIVGRHKQTQEGKELETCFFRGSYSNCTNHWFYQDVNGEMGKYCFHFEDLLETWKLIKNRLRFEDINKNIEKFQSNLFNMRKDRYSKEELKDLKSELIISWEKVQSDVESFIHFDYKFIETDGHEELLAYIDKLTFWNNQGYENLQVIFTLE